MRHMLKLLILLALAAPCAAMGEAVTDLTYYYFNPCASCNEGPEFVSAFYERVRDAGLSESYRVLTSNAFSDRSPLAHALEALGLPPSTELPLLVMGERYLSGHDALETDLTPWLTGDAPSSAAETAPAAGEPTLDPIAEAELIYLYAPFCASCAQMKQALAAFSDSFLTVREINLYEAPDEAETLYEIFEVPEAERLVPIVFLGDRYLTDPVEVTELLSLWIAEAQMLQLSRGTLGRRPRTPLKGLAP